jgi:midasin (ATPase involved in ribosome maturation)
MLKSLDKRVGYIPDKDDTYIPLAHHAIVKKIISSDEFFPVYIYGIPGVGKTTCIRQVCAELKKPFFRIQITKDITEEDLIGSVRLKDGNTVWQDGGVMTAYRTGGICVLDEIDQNNYALMSLQPVLEGKPYFIKATGELVKPAPGFQLFATANTKGDGSSYEYSTTMILNSAFLDRFALTLEQKFPTETEELKIAGKFISKNKITIDDKEVALIVKWIKKIRDMYLTNPQEYPFVSTRRLLFILKAYKICNRNMKKALGLTMSKFAPEIREASVKLYESMSPEETEFDKSSYDYSEVNDDL